MAIEIKKSHEGLFHKATGTPAGDKIPMSKIEKGLHSDDPKIRKEANFARNAREWHHK
jgi:hypothetical protein